MDIRHFAIAALGAAVLSVSVGAAPGAAPSATEVNRRLGLRASTVIRLDADHAPGVPFQMMVAIEGELVTLDMQPVSVRSEGYRVYTAGADDVRHEVKPAPERTFRGVLLESPDSIVAASVLDDGLFARIERAGGLVDWIEPLAPHFEDRDDLAGLHVVYADADVPETGALCGTTAHHLVDHQGVLAAGGGGSADAGVVSEAELACDADLDYLIDYGSTEAVEDRINTVINQMNVQYERDVAITHRITTIIVRTSATYASTDPEVLLNEFRNRWNNNHGDVIRDVAHLFTGKEIDGGTIGIAFIGVICNTPVAYGLVQSDFNGVLACATDLSAHELGHNWNANHCNCPNNTMNPGITCANVFSQASIDMIVGHRNSRNCLVLVDPGGGPGNDDCSAATPVGDGSTPFTTVDATTDGPVLPGSCDEGSGVAFVDDVWYRYTASCNGELTISLCNSDYDTRLAVYTDASCPGSLVACNDDACGAGGTRSEVTLTTTLGATYLIRIGGADDTGSGTMVITCDGTDNNDCSDALAVGDGTFPFDTTMATTDGPPLPASCEEGFGLSFVDDIWFAYTAPCTGVATVSLCGSGYDTRLAIYEDGNCPGPIISCNDDSCGLQSESAFLVAGGAVYLVRVGGFSGGGTGTMQISCVGTPACPEDVNGDGIIGFADILRILANYGPCEGCPEDVDGSGDAGFSDVLRILANWGPCPM